MQGAQLALSRRNLSAHAVKKEAQQTAQLEVEDEISIAPDSAELQTAAGGVDADDSTTCMRSLPVEIDFRTLLPMVDTLLQARSHGLPDIAPPHSTAQLKLEVPLWQLDRPLLKLLSKKLAAQWENKRKDPEDAFRRLLKERSKLPVMYSVVQTHLRNTLEETDVLVVRANTGSGKTTQIPQIILDHEIEMGRGAFCNIAITQPRRISATSVARRVAQERNEKLGQSVGYEIRFQHVPPCAKGSLLYCTSGILLKRLQVCEDLLTDYSHIIIDEVHERSMVIDCTLTLLRDLLSKRKAEQKFFPKLILMSATFDSGFFINYFKESRIGVPLRTESIDIEGKLFPVDVHYLNELLPDLVEAAKSDRSIRTLLESTKRGDATKAYLEEEVRFASTTKQVPASKVSRRDGTYEHHQELDGSEDGASAPFDTSTSTESPVSPVGLVAATVLHILQKSTSGDILVFLLGMSDIDKIADLLMKVPSLESELESGLKLRLFKLHSSLSGTNNEVFEEVPAGCRRIVLATNIAETSITLPDVEHVIDLGKIRRQHYDPQSRIDLYPPQWISKSNQKQRQGRAGRVQAGHYYALFTRERGDSFEENTPPESVRMDLVEPCLDLKICPSSANVREFLGRAPSAPKPEAIEAALAYLQTLGALTEDEQLTPLGRMLAKFPVHPSMMKAVMLGLIFRCTEPMLIIASQDIDSPIVFHPFEKGKATASKRMFSAESESDLIAQINAFKAFDIAEWNKDWETVETLKQDRYVRPSTFREMSRVARQICEELSYAGLLPYPSGDRSVFDSIPADLNQNANCIPLIKALSMNLFNSDIALRKGKSPRSFYAANGQKSLLNHRSVNFEPRKNIISPRKVRKADDLMMYITNRQDSESPMVSWLASTSMITPLLASLFARTCDETEDGLLLNDWIEFQIKFTKSIIDNDIARKILVEFRKAFERFCILALTGLEDTTRRIESHHSIDTHHGIGMQEMEGEHPGKEHQQTSINGQLRDAFVRGVVETLEADDKAIREIFAADSIAVEERREKAGGEDGKEAEKPDPAKDQCGP